MKRKNRLLKNIDFKKIIESKSKLQSKNLIIYYKLNSLDYSRFGISVSSKIANAVGRNKIRRQLRAIIIKNIDFNLNSDYVLIVKKDYLNSSFLDIEKDFISLFNKVLKSLREAKA